MPFFKQIFAEGYCCRSYNPACGCDCSDYGMYTCCNKSGSQCSGCPCGSDSLGHCNICDDEGDPDPPTPTPTPTAAPWVVQGWRVVYKNSGVHDLVKGQPMSLSGITLLGNVNTGSYTSSPYTIVSESGPTASYGFSISKPAGWDVFGTTCYNGTNCHCDDPSLCPRSWNPTTLTVNRSGGYVDHYWHFVGSPTNLRYACNSTGTRATVTWEGGDVGSFAVRKADLDDGIDWTTTTCATGVNANDYCNDNVTAEYVTLDVVPGHRQSLWLHAERFWGTYASIDFKCDPPPTGYFYSVDNIACTVSGWACDTSRGTQPIRVDLYHSNMAWGTNPTPVWVGNVNNANIYQQNLVDAGVCGPVGNVSYGNHGFVYDLRTSGTTNFQDGVARTLYGHAIGIDENGVNNGMNPVLTNAPVNVLCATPTPTTLQSISIRTNFYQKSAGTLPTITPVQASSDFPIPFVTGVLTSNNTHWSITNAAGCAQIVSTLTNPHPNLYTVLSSFLFPNNPTDGVCLLDDAGPSMTVTVRAVEASIPSEYSAQMPFPTVFVNAPGSYMANYTYVYSGSSWMKLSGTSLIRSSTSPLVNNIPYIIQTFDGMIGVDKRSKGLIDDDNGTAGFVAGNIDMSPLDISSSSNNWRVSDSNYSLSTAFAASSLDTNVGKILSRSPLVELPILSGDIQLTNNRMNIIVMTNSSSPVSLNRINTVDNTKGSVLIILNETKTGLGDVTINVDTDISSKIIIARNILIGRSVRSVHAVLIAKGVLDLSSASNTLFIRGNILAGGGISNMRTRADSDNSRPSVYLQFDPNYYTNVLWIWEGITMER